MKFKKGDSVVLLDSDTTSFNVGSIGTISEVYSDEEVEVYFERQLAYDGDTLSAEQAISSWQLEFSIIHDSPLYLALK